MATRKPTARVRKPAAKKPAPRLREAKGEAKRPKERAGTRTGKTATRKGSGAPAPSAPERWELRLYVAGHTPRSVEALRNLHRICEEHLLGRYRIEVIDLLVNPALARGDQILAVPTLVRQLPAPMKKIIGDFSNTERVLVGLNIRPLPDGESAR